MGGLLVDMDVVFGRYMDVYAYFSVIICVVMDVHCPFYAYLWMCRTEYMRIYGCETPGLVCESEVY
jgi:hypothetical protein